MSTIQLNSKVGVPYFNGNTTREKKLAETYLKVSELGTRFNLSFSSQLAFGNKIIALDGIKKCLLIVKTDKGLTLPTVIDLNKVVAVSIKKSYGSINQGALKNKDLETFLKRIDLQFEFNNKSEPIVLPFYEREINDQSDLPKLERNAKIWQMVLSSLLGSQQAKQSMNEAR